MRIPLTKSLDKYIKACKKTDWVFDEAYKFEYANFISQNVVWNSQSDEEVLQILLDSQKKIYTCNQQGIQFLLKSGRKNYKEFIGIEDVKLFRTVHEGANPLTIDWSDRAMSFTGLSAWLSSLFPEKLYPVPLKGFDQTIRHLFGYGKEDFPKVGMEYLSKCQSFMAETEKLLQDYPFEELHLPNWNKYYAENPDLGLPPKTRFSKIDWVWLVQDFHLFVHREVLGLYRNKEKGTQLAEAFEPIAVEGESKLATHMRSERSSSFIRKIKQHALSSNPMLNCEVCGFSFVETYGEMGEGYIEAHHIEPLGNRKGNQATKKEDIALVCSNCHRMLHKEINGKLLSVEELKARITPGTGVGDRLD